MEVRSRNPVAMRRPIHHAPTQRGSPWCNSCLAPANMAVNPCGMSAKLHLPVITQSGSVHIHVELQDHRAQQVAHSWPKDRHREKDGCKQEVAVRLPGTEK